MAFPIIYLIRHGEKPAKDPDGKDPPGLSKIGSERAQDLVNVFGKDSQYNIGYIIAQKPKGDGDEDRPFLTVKPLADSLGDAVAFDHSIKRDDADKVGDAVRKFERPGNILICWEHDHLPDIAKAIGISDPPDYPGSRFDLIWTVMHPYNQISDITSEDCPKLDDAFKNDKWVQIDGGWVEQHD